MYHASSRMAYEMSGLVQVARYMHLLTRAQYGSDATLLRSSSVDGDMSDVRRHFGHGVVVELQDSIPNSERMWVVNCSWLTLRMRCCCHWVMEQPRIHSTSPPSVRVNLLFNSSAARSDSSLKFVASSISSTLVVEMVMRVPILRE